MTHEQIASGEHQHGPEHDHSLPDAATIPGGLSPGESDAPQLEEDL
jgi:hypothetical protein